MSNSIKSDNEVILIVDDDERICQILSLYLQSKGYEVVTCKTGTRALSLFTAKKPDLVLLDVMLPGMDGWEVLSKLRRVSNVPVIMLTARGDTSDRVQGLDCGADDYIVKPFDSKELIARIRAVMRRAGIVEVEKPKVVSVGNLVINMEDYVVTENGKSIDVPPKELELLFFLVQNKDNVVSRGQILDAVWGVDYFGDNRTVDVHIKRLRDRFEETEPWHICTIWGVGYKLEDEKR